MKANELRDFLYEQIPLSQALAIEIEEDLTIFAPLAPSKNHMGTAFGGSIGAVMILACYSWFFQRLGVEGKHSHVLIQTAHTDYLRPITSDMRARCLAPPEDEVQRVLQQFERKGVARIKLGAQILGPQGVVLAQFSGDFVATKS